MATIGSLAVNIVAKTDKFLSGLNSAKSSLGKFVSGISYAQGIISGLSSLGFARLTLDVIEAGDAIADISAKLGIGTEQIGALQYAAEQLGSSTEAMNIGLQFLNKNVGLLQQGSQAATDSFARLGLKASDLVGLSLDQKFLTVANAIKSLGSDTEQAAAAQQIFGKGGQELLPIIRAGTDAIIAQGEAAAATGKLFNQDQADGLNEAADAIKNLTASFQGMSKEFVTTFVPAIIWATETLAAFFRLIKSASQFNERLTLAAMNAIGYDVSAERADLARRSAATSGASGTGPLTSPLNGRPVPVHLIKDSTSNGDTVQLGTVGLR